MSVLVIMASGKLSAQCINSTNFGAATANGTVASYQNITTCAFAGERSSLTINFLCALYSFNCTGGTGNYLTVTNNANQVIAAGVPPLTGIIIPATGVYWLHVTTSGPPTCGTDSQCHTTQWQASPLPPCATVPPSTAIASNTSICSGSGVNLSLSADYMSACGYTVQWQSSSTGTAGTYANIGTGLTITSPTLSANTAFQAIITCANGPVSVTSTPVMVNVGNPNVANSLSNLTNICPNENVNLSLSTPYTNVSYLWQESVFSAIGPWTNVANGTGPVVTASNVNVPTYYQAIVTCTATPSASVASLPVFVNVMGPTVDNVPYFESFEGVTIPNRMPNCSWAVTSTSVCQTYITSTFNSRVPFSGNKFASFKAPTTSQGQYFFTNGIQLNAGVTYSASARYITDGNSGWSEFSLLHGTTQSSSGLTPIASVTGTLLNTFYKLLDNTFTVPVSGIYYIAVKAVGSSSALYFTWDDLEITVPCHLNPLNLTVSSPSTACMGQAIVLSAATADTYSWSTGDVTAVISVTPNGGGPYTVTGTNLASGCSAIASSTFNILPSPPVGVVALTPTVCAGSPAVLTAFGASSYTWTTGANTAVLQVNPLVSTTYSVQGSNAFGCSGVASLLIGVNTLPTVIANGNTQICEGEVVTLIGTGALSYQWLSPKLFTQINPVTDNPLVTTIYTLTGTDANGCSNKTTISVAVDPCLGINEISDPSAGIIVYPNPANSEITINTHTAVLKNIEISDIAGRIVMKTSSADTHIVLNIHTLSKGAYYVKVQSEGKTEVRKIVKQ